MIDTMKEPRLVKFAEGHRAALPATPGESRPARQEDTPQPALSDVTVQSPGPEQQRTRTIAEIETIAIAARAAWHSAEDAHRATRDENRAFYENFKKIVDHHADALKQMEARFGQSEQQMHGLLLEANLRIAEHQAMVARFNRTTRRFALSAFVMMLILLVLLEMSWWVS